jgi:hypothetical protein
MVLTPERMHAFGVYRIDAANRLALAEDYVQPPAENVCDDLWTREVSRRDVVPVAEMPPCRSVRALATTL